ncbi:ArsB/NhaD family transporter [Alteribacillus sp. HJP-4]|uniref:ArsB/NhaD family transporter n=1 Tax=Alteribacillus sp. HJP-4 TaxID=2775394 RepID=UPI0035CD01CF
MESFLSLFIFTACYILLIAEKGNKALIAIAGAVLMAAAGVVEMQLMFTRYIDWHTIALLLAMMMIVSISSQSGLFEYAAIKSAQIVKGRPLPLLFFLSVLTGVGSAFLNNVTTVLLVTPVVFTITKKLHLQPVPFLIAIILSSNIGGTATIIGDPPNLMIGQAARTLLFNDFLLNLGPPAVLIFFSVICGISMYYKKELLKDDKKEQRQQLLKVDAKRYIKSMPLLKKSLLVLLLTISAFLLQPVIKVELTAIAMGGALLLLFMTQEEISPEKVFRQMEWTTIFFFIGLFGLIGGIEEVGYLEEIAKGLMFLTEGDMMTTSISLLWISGFVSGFVDNIPFVAAMIPVILELESYGIYDLEPIWWSLALGACLGGNATVIGATANVIVAGLAVKEGKGFSYFDFLKVGIPVVIFSLTISTIYIYLRYLIFY